ncbi:putative siderophore transport system ATP-binding protein YusV [Clavibacter michiganensis]|uniref:Putative siderophore transport system ATP-binding protein YusV n=1 Tax=Clavibacter michiganensis TaxID=28447 RepID=A0A251Y9K8_9MICO|nr:ABC transporter ATP-binding protein [Clavibacter michiganensis]OUE20937.1 putative siderophore transport system ATP-binding protein YusV [Clavibacter michiganensis]
MTLPASTAPIARAADPDPSPASPAASALEARDITVAYGDAEVVHGAGLEIRPGCVTALVGPNGSGKSTLLRTMARLQAARSGSLVLREEGAEAGTGVDAGRESDALDLSLRRFARRVALLTQGRPTPGGLSVRDVVEFGRYPHRGRFGGADPEGRSAVDRALDLTGLDALADRGVDQLSGGQLQRVWLASCLAQETGVLLLDEPTTYLDLRYQVELLDLVRDLADDGRIAVGVVLHDLDQAAALADTVALLSDGRIVKTGTPSEVLTPDLLTEVYGIPVEVHADPTTGSLRTRAVARHHHRNERLHP